MAATWDFVLVSPCFILNEGMEYEKKIEIKEMWSIDDWEWTNQQKVQDVSDMEKGLADGKIIVIYFRGECQFETNQWKSMGMYIEKEKEYIYTLWLNTEGIPELDSSTINEENIRHYKRAYHALEKWIVEHEVDFKVIAIGVESDVVYCEDKEEMMRQSSNVVMWIFNKGGVFYCQGLVY